MQWPKAAVLYKSCVCGVFLPPVRVKRPLTYWPFCSDDPVKLKWADLRRSGVTQASQADQAELPGSLWICQSLGPSGEGWQLQYGDEEILHHLECIKPCKQWDVHYQPQLVSLPDFERTINSSTPMKKHGLQQKESMSFLNWPAGATRWGPEPIVMNGVRNPFNLLGQAG